MSRLALSLVLVACGAVWLVAELIQLAGHQTPISVVLRDWGLSSCALPFGWTLLAGHLWVNWDLWDEHVPFAAWPIWVAAACALVVADLAFILWVRSPRPEWPLALRIVRYPGLWALLGLATGALTWPQRSVL